ncbi:MAG: ATP-binding cassette domain-containing protein [Thermoplasmata archaeon]
MSGGPIPTLGASPIIEVNDLVKIYGGGRGPTGQEVVRAVDGISFSIGEGEFFGFLGPNGAGKTTTIKIITTLLGKTSGRVRVAGHDLDRDGEAIRKIIGYAGQSAGVDGELTGRENLMLMGRFYHLPTPIINDRIEQLLDVLQLQDAADRPAFTYSGGMRKRLDLGSGLVHKPQILFLDEPTTGLDPQTRNAVWEYIRKLHREEGTTIFLTTQYMEEADQLCERLAIIDGGKIVTSGTPRELKAAIGDDVVTLRLPQDERFEAARAQALALVRGVPGVQSASPFDQGVTARTRNGGATLLEIVRQLESERIAVNEVAIAHPTLDQVFLQHTGRAMRVEEVKPSSRSGYGPRMMRRR